MPIEQGWKALAGEALILRQLSAIVERDSCSFKFGAITLFSITALYLYALSFAAGAYDIVT